MDNLLGSKENHRSPAYDWVSKLDLNDGDGFQKDAWNLALVSKNKDALAVDSTLDEGKAQFYSSHSRNFRGLQVKKL